MTTWIEPPELLTDRLGLPRVPLPVRDATAAAIDDGRVEPAAIALDVDIWLAGGDGTDVQRRVLSKLTAALAYVAAAELLAVGRPSPAARLLDVGVRHAPDDPSIRTLRGLARWRCSHRLEALGDLATAVDQFAAAGQVSPMLSILTAQALSEAGRHEVALELLDELAATEPRVALFWDLRDTIERRAVATRT